MNKIFSMMLVVGIAMSCKKTNEQLAKNGIDELQSGVKENNFLEFGQIHLASSVTQSATISGTWNIKQEYLNNYVHFYQMDAKPEFPGNVLCGPTSYMLAAHMIATAKNVWYPSSKAKVGAIYTKLSQAGKFDDGAGMYISDVPWFCNTYDYPVVKSSYLRTMNRDVMKEYLEFYIKSGYPIIATVNVFGLQGAYWENDLDMTDLPGVKYYVSKNGPVGHFILLTGIKINTDGSGRIWYKDPLSRTNETRCASYTRILDAMKYNGNNDYYDAVAIFEWLHLFSYQLLGVPWGVFISYKILLHSYQSFFLVHHIVFILVVPQTHTQILHC